MVAAATMIHRDANRATGSLMARDTEQRDELAPAPTVIPATIDSAAVRHVVINHPLRCC